MSLIISNIALILKGHKILFQSFLVRWGHPYSEATLNISIMLGSKIPLTPTPTRRLASCSGNENFYDIINLSLYTQGCQKVSDFGGGRIHKKHL